MKRIGVLIGMRGLMLLLVFEAGYSAAATAQETDDTDVVRVFIQKLRRKLGDDPKKPACIFNHRGVGYRMARQDDA